MDALNTFLYGLVPFYISQKKYINKGNTKKDLCLVLTEVLRVINCVYNYNFNNITDDGRRDYIYIQKMNSIFLPKSKDTELNEKEDDDDLEDSSMYSRGIEIIEEMYEKYKDKFSVESVWKYLQTLLFCSIPSIKTCPYVEVTYNKKTLESTKHSPGKEEGSIDMDTMVETLLACIKKTISVTTNRITDSIIDTTDNIYTEGQSNRNLSAKTSRRRKLNINLEKISTRKLTKKIPIHAKSTLVLGNYFLCRRQYIMDSHTTYKDDDTVINEGYHMGIVIKKNDVVCLEDVDVSEKHVVRLHDKDVLQQLISKYDFDNIRRRCDFEKMLDDHENDSKKSLKNKENAIALPVFRMYKKGMKLINLSLFIIRSIADDESINILKSRPQKKLKKKK